MRKILIALLLCLSFGIINASANNQHMIRIDFSIGWEYMRIDNDTHTLDAVPFIQDGRTYVPIRALTEAMPDVTIDWNAPNVIITGKDKKIVLNTQDQTTEVNGQPVSGAQAILKDGRTFVPIRFIMEHFNATVEWNPDSQRVFIRYLIGDHYVELQNGKRVYLGDTVQAVEATFGKPERVDVSTQSYPLHIYNSDYANFIMVGIENDSQKVVSIYTNSRGFRTQIHSWGDSASTSESPYSFFVDGNNGDRVYACYLNIASGVSAHSEFSADELERQVIDLTNAFRAAYDRSPLRYDSAAATAARRHAEDMARNNYFSHTGLDGSSPSDRYRRAGGTGGAGENCYYASYSGSSFDVVDGWINSSGHRENMLRDYAFMGAGYAYDPSNGYYWVQVFRR